MSAAAIFSIGVSARLLKSSSSFLTTTTLLLSSFMGRDVLRGSLWPLVRVPPPPGSKRGERECRRKIPVWEKALRLVREEEEKFLDAREFYQN